MGPGSDSDMTLEEVGLSDGQQIRFRRKGRARWQTGVVKKRERDGSICITDNNGAFRTVSAEMIEVSRRGPRGGTIWEPLSKP